MHRLKHLKTTLSAGNQLNAFRVCKKEMGNGKLAKEGH